jgi:hypothetical protein
MCVVVHGVVRRITLSLVLHVNFTIIRALCPAVGTGTRRMYLVTTSVKFSIVLLIVN